MIRLGRSPNLRIAIGYRGIHRLGNDCSSWMEEDSKYVLGTYARSRIVLSRGDGVHLFDINGKRYLDLSSGIAVNALGHNSPVVRKALMDQFQEISHCSNLYFSAPQVKLARSLVESSTFSKVFICNSGTEANEAALKFARKYQQGKRSTIIAFKGGFHGRTMGSLSVTYKPSIRTPFEPMLSGVEFLDLNDTETCVSLIKSGQVGAVIVEPVQGEGGIIPCSMEFLKSVDAACKQFDTPLIVDEVQIGCGRSGELWAHTKYGIKPDMMTIAKPLAGGLPIGAVLVSDKIAACINNGDHGTTFGGNPLISNVACAVFEEISQPIFLDNVKAQGEFMVNSLTEFSEEQPHIIKQVRSGGGLLIGVELEDGIDVGNVIETCAENGLIIISAGDKGNVLRICPPLIITSEEAEESMSILKAGLLTVAEG